MNLCFTRSFIVMTDAVVFRIVCIHTIQLSFFNGCSRSITMYVDEFYEAVANSVRCKHSNAIMMSMIHEYRTFKQQCHA